MRGRCAVFLVGSTHFLLAHTTRMVAFSLMGLRAGRFSFNIIKKPSKPKQNQIIGHAQQIRPLPHRSIFVLAFSGRVSAREGHALSSSTPPQLDFRCRHPARQISPEMRVPPLARPASSRRPGVTVNAADARLALATAYVGMWGDLESAPGVWVTDVHSQVTRATPATGKAISTAEAEAWCATALPKQDKQTYKSKNRKRSHHRIVAFRRLDDRTRTGNFPQP